VSGGFWQRLFRTERRVFERGDWAGFAGPQWADRIMDVRVTDNFHAKQGRSTGRWMLHAGDRRLSVYLKRHFRLPLLHGILATFWPGRGWSPALQEARHLDWARSQDLPVPAVVAAGETIGPWGRLQSFLAVEELADMLPLHQAIPAAAEQLPPETFERWKCGLVAEMVRLTLELHRRNYFHKDLYLCHFYIPRIDTLVEPSRWRGRMHLIDLHRLGHHWLLWPVSQVKDIAQLLYSSDVHGVTAEDRQAFWELYSRGFPRLWAACLKRLVLLKGRRYRGHNQKKKARAAA
jgi:heptose I phosphotransferase